MGRWWFVAFGAAALTGCGGDARVDLAAADALDAVAEQMRVTVNEYDRDLGLYDDSRETAVTAAFIARIQRDHASAALAAKHGEDFAAALARIRSDRTVAGQRRAAASSQIEAVAEVARGLRRLGIESLSLQDEVRRYVTSLTETMRRVKAEQAAAKAAAPRIGTTTAPASRLTALRSLLTTCATGECN